MSRSRDNLYIDWNGVRVAGNATVTFMLFTTQNRNRNASFAEARRIVTLPNEVLANLTAAEKATVDQLWHWSSGSKSDADGKR